MTHLSQVSQFCIMKQGTSSPLKILNSYYLQFIRSIILEPGSYIVTHRKKETERQSLSLHQLNVRDKYYYKLAGIPQETMRYWSGY